MDEELSNVLGNEELDSNAKTEAIKKLIEDNYVSTEKYSHEVENVKKENKQLKSDIKAKNTEIEGYKNSQLTDDQKKQKELEDIANTKRDLAIERSQIQAEKILSKVITDDKELECLVKDISKEDIEATKLLAQNIVNTITKQKEATEAKIREELINDTPKPTGGEADEVMTKDKFSKLSYNEQVKFKIENPEGYKQLFN
ncbi:MAG: hypothetical protein HFJ55_05600 [Clostridia bacterium]|nr:hypothetical protein [Clostridia bacterium]